MPGGSSPGEYAEDDFARSGAEWVEPLGRRLWGHDVWTVPPNSQGYLTLAAASILDRLDLPSMPDEAEWPHLLAEAAKQAGVDRPAVLHEHADAEALLSDVRIARWAAAPEAGRSPAGDTIS